MTFNDFQMYFPNSFHTFSKNPRLCVARYCSLRQRLVSRMFPDVSKIRLMNAEQEQVIRTGRRPVKRDDSLKEWIEVL